MPKPTLIVFARSPAIGVGKTRLARDIGAVEAWRVYRAMSTRALWRLRDPRWRLVLRLEGRKADPAWPRLPIEPQGRGDLGARLTRALRAHGEAPVAVVGTDVPELTPARVANAFRRRNAIGPASDGGFWLLALEPRRARAVHFAGVRWSSVHTLKDTLSVLGPLAVLETLTDVDDGTSLALTRSSPSGAGGSKGRRGQVLQAPSVRFADSFPRGGASKV
ncbi:MAG: TIGR04282 family arsenosugar biosynthesis glycosyltransferase [Ignavibacteriales bacterium]